MHDGPKFDTATYHYPLELRVIDHADIMITGLPGTTHHG